MKVKITKEYQDSKLNKRVAVGDELDVTEDRAVALISGGVAFASGDTAELAAKIAELEVAVAEKDAKIAELEVAAKKKA